MPAYVSCPVYRNVIDEESSFGIGLQEMYIPSVSSEWRSQAPQTQMMTKNVPVIVWNELWSGTPEWLPCQASGMKGLLLRLADWLARCQCTVTRWHGNFDLLFLCQCGSTYNCLSRSVPETHMHVVGTLNSRQTAPPPPPTPPPLTLSELRGQARFWFCVRFVFCQM